MFYMWIILLTIGQGHSTPTAYIEKYTNIEIIDQTAYFSARFDLASFRQKKDNLENVLQGLARVANISGCTSCQNTLGLIAQELSSMELPKIRKARFIKEFFGIASEETVENLGVQVAHSFDNAKVLKANLLKTEIAVRTIYDVLNDTLRETEGAVIHISTLTNRIKEQGNQIVKNEAKTELSVQLMNLWILVDNLKSMFKRITRLSMANGEDLTADHIDRQNLQDILLEVQTKTKTDHELAFGIDDRNLTLYYGSIKITTIEWEPTITVLLEIPLKSTKWRAYAFLPIPVPLNSSSVFQIIDIPDGVFFLHSFKGEVYRIPKATFRRCNHNRMICDLRSSSTPRGDHVSCVRHLLDMTPENSCATMVTTIVTPIFKPFLNNSRVLFVADNHTAIQEICEDGDARTLLINGTGTIEIDKSCFLRWGDLSFYPDHHFDLQGSHIYVIFHGTNLSNAIFFDNPRSRRLSRDTIHQAHQDLIRLSEEMDRLDPKIPLAEYKDPTKGWSLWNIVELVIGVLIAGILLKCLRGILSCLPCSLLKPAEPRVVIDVNHRQETREKTDEEEGSTEAP